jgi:hypothetical protein
MMFHNVFNVITIIETANPHTRPKRAIVEMILILTYGMPVSKAIFVSRLEQMGKIREQLIRKRDEFFEANLTGFNWHIGALMVAT